MLKYFNEVADNIRVIDNITNQMFSMVEVDGFDNILLDNLFEKRFVHISIVEKWINSDIGKEIVTKYKKEWQEIFDAFMKKDEFVINKLKQLNLDQKNNLKDLYKNKSILIYSR